MSIDNVQDITPRIQYVASGGQTVFPYPFPIFDDSDLVVDVDGVVLVITTNYTVSGAGDDNGGNVTLTAGATAGQVVTIYRDIAIARDTDFQQNGPWRSAAINDELDRMTLIDQQLELATTRALRVNVNDEADFDDLVLPSASARASRFLAFDANGEPVMSAGTGADAGLREDIATGAAGAVTFVDTVADMKALTGLVDGAVVVTKEYATGKGGGGTYLYYTTPPSTADSFIYHDQTTGGGQFKLLDAKKNILQAGADSSGGSDFTPILQRVFDSGANSVDVPSGTYAFLTAPEFASPSDVTFVGECPETSIFTWASGSFALKSVSDVKFLDIGFVATKSDAIYPDIRVSNYANITFENCHFSGFGGLTANKAGSTCLFLLSSDTSSSTIAAGNSVGARVIRCKFYGDARKTNFAVRVHNNDFTATTATNKGAVIDGCEFNDFNWNACEIAGVTVSNCIVTNCVANSCGLAPFEIDKGSHSNIVDGCTINRLLGNIDLVANPNTRTYVAVVQGFDPTTGYAYNNRVSDITAYLLKADLDAYGKGCAAVNLSYAQRNTVDGVTVYCDGVPVRGGTGRFGLACVSFDTASGNTVKNVTVTNASTGIVQPIAQNAAMTSQEPNVFESIRNIGTMTEEPIQIDAGAGAGAFIRVIMRDLSFSTDFSQPYNAGPNYYAIRAIASGSSSHFVKISDSVFKIPAAATNWLAFDNISRFGLNNVMVDEGGAPLLATRFVDSGGGANPTYFGISNVSQNFAQEPIDLLNAFQNLDATAIIVAGIGDSGFPYFGPAVVFSSGQPNFPAAANWNQNLRVERLTKVAASFFGWTIAAGAWRTYGTVN